MSSEGRLKVKRHRVGPARRPGSPSGRQSATYNPAFRIAVEFDAACDPTKQDGAVRTLADMTPEQRAEMERLYGKGAGRKP